MTYLKAKWLHESSEFPVLLYSELDEKRWELRKVEMFRDGTAGWADKEHEHRSMLGLEPIPSLSEINAQREFEAVDIGRDEFERAWASARIAG